MNNLILKNRPLIVYLKRWFVLALLIANLTIDKMHAQCDCTPTGNFPTTIHGINVTVSNTGDVTDYGGNYSSCSLNAGPSWVGIRHAFSQTYTFSIPVNNVTFVITAASLSYPLGLETNSTFGGEDFTFSTSSGTLTSYQCVGRGCLFGQIGNTYYAIDNGSQNGNGGVFVLHASSSYTSVTISGLGGSNGSLLGLCTESFPVCAIAPTFSTACLPVNTTSLSIVSAVGFSSIPSYTWAGPGGFSSTSANPIFPNNGIYGTYTVTASDVGCTTNSIVTTISQSQFTPSIVSSSVACYGNATGSATTTVVGGQAPYSYGWSTNPIQHSNQLSAVVSGNYTCTITDGLGCAMSATTQINQPSAALSQTIHALTTQACVGQTIALTSSISGGNASSYTYTWLPSGAVSSSISVTSVVGTSSVYTLSSQDANMCPVTNTISLTFIPQPTITISGATNLCTAQSSTLTAGGAGTNGTYTWSPATGLTTVSGSSVIVNPVATQNYTISAFNGSCPGTTTISVNVYASPTASFTSNQVCSGTATPLTDASNGNGSVLTNYIWDFDNDGIANITATSAPTFTFPAYGNTAVSYTAVTTPTIGLNCQSAITQSVWVNPNPIANYSFTNMCINTQPSTFDASSSNIAIGTNTNYVWGFGDGITFNTSLTAISHTYSTAQAYNVTLTVTSDKGCATAITKQVEVYQKPLVNLAINSSCLGSAASFTANSLVGSGTINAWFWDVNNSITTFELNGQTNSFVFPSAGTQTLNLEAVTVDGCVDLISKTLYVDYVPDTQFSVTQNKGCPTFCTTFNDHSEITGPAIISKWDWAFGDGSMASCLSNVSQNKCYTNTSTNQSLLYTATLTTTSDKGCRASLVQTNIITVYPKPKADYVVTPNPGNVVTPLVYFTNQSVDYTKWWWIFGDCTKRDSLSTDPTHFYESATAETYNSALIVVNQYGCKDTAYAGVYIGPEFTFYIPNAFTPNDDGVNDLFTGKGIGIDTYEMWIYDRWGTSVYYTDDISKGWDGKFQGKESKQDIYIWKVNISDVLNKSHEYVGHVTVLK